MQKKSPVKKRLDQLLVERGFAPTRERAQSLILAGQVIVGDSSQVKAGHRVDESIAIRIRGEDHPYVSRGGLKLEAALKAFQISVKDRVALDVGASTGGFTHVLLLQGIKKVHAIDVGQNQLDWKIRSDPRVLSQEKVNARYLEFSQIGEKVDLIVMDVSFISIEKILPALIQFASIDTDWITLIKPQFEVGREKIGKGGIVSSEADQQEVIQRITQFASDLKLVRMGLVDSPIYGTEGNKEFLAHWKLQK